MNDLHLWYSYSFMYSFNWMNLPTLTSQDYNSFWKIHCFIFFPYKSIRDQTWPCRKIGQGQPRSIMWINLEALMHLMLQTKFKGHQPFGSGEVDFLSFLPYMDMAAILLMWPGPFEQTFVPPSQRSSIWNLTLTGPVVSEQKMFKECGWWRPTYPISSPVSLWLMWAKNLDTQKFCCNYLKIVTIESCIQTMQTEWQTV